ncbi:DNA polymerase Y family protein [Ideonella sp. DXS29W]|uniref:DNA polymerase Y family protein n=1 Tax=Ideonella lacteola TaxID=2984193 RepID=A0ABU9BRE0_9BURK
MLWVGFHFPSLSLEAFSALLGHERAGEPIALQAQHRIAAVNAAAAEGGVKAGMKRATALALVPELILGTADPLRDAEALQAAAHALLAFSPTVVPAPPHGLLIEVQASLRCFGGLARLWQRLAEALAPLGHRWQRASAPTALGALLLAREAHQADPPAALTRSPLCLAEPAWDDLHQRLWRLPAAALATDASALAQFEAMGLRTLGDLRRQPRAGLARRFGPELLTMLDRAWGLVPDPLEPIAPPLRFLSHADLWARADHTEALLAGAQVLLARLLAWAQARHARVQSFVLLLHHESRLRANSQGEAGAHVSRLEIMLAEPTGDAQHLHAVLRERLAREPLAAPVLSLSLACDAPVLGPPPNGELFPSQAGQREGLLRLVERLQARLGPEAVQRLAVQADHRPERANARQSFTAPDKTASFTFATPGATPNATLSALPARLTRPAWLLAQPQPLMERQARPCLAGQPLHLLAGPERIETGWWDGDLVCRDYFIAQPADGPLLWIYRVRPAPPQGEPGWFLHGRFG